MALKLESLKDQKDSDIFGLREQCQRLQVQLNQGHSGFSDFKEKKTKEIEDLKAHIDEIKGKEPEKLVHLQSDLESSKAELEQKNLEIDDLVKSKSQLVEEIQDWVRRSNEDAQKKSAESEESIDNLNKEIALFKANLQELDV